MQVDFHFINVTLSLSTVALVDLGVQRSLIPQGISGSDAGTLDFASFLLLYGSLCGLTAAGRGQGEGQGQGISRAERVSVLWVPTARGVWREVGHDVTLLCPLYLLI
jgi:hypothetical protein